MQFGKRWGAHGRSSYGALAEIDWGDPRWAFRHRIRQCPHTVRMLTRTENAISQVSQGAIPGPKPGGPTPDSRLIRATALDIQCIDSGETSLGVAQTSASACAAD